MIPCEDTASDHLQAGLRCMPTNRLREHAEAHLLRSIELAGDGQRSFILVSALHWYGRLLVELGRPGEAIVQWERRLAVRSFPNEDRLERRTTEACLTDLKAEVAAGEAAAE